MESPANSSSTLESARLVTTYLLREPVKDAVKEALREEGVSIERIDTETTSDSGGGSGVSKLGVVLGLVTLAGVAYAVRQKQDTDVGWSSDSGSDRLGEHHHEESESRSTTEETAEHGSAAESGSVGESGSTAVSDEL
mgnify:CR=1 FL=1